ncbi:MAG: GGDEF domain-containing protein [Candidatus Aenigmarchaeota archaeon]|nr:GGDEF domain-containing protein [Candidatus Aenigmarchaeota archaeon]
MSIENIKQIQEIYANSHNRRGLIEALKEAGVYGAIIVDNGHHGYGFLNGEIRDFDSIPYRDRLNNDSVEVNENGEKIIAIPIIGVYGLAAVLYLAENAAEDIAKAAENSLRLYDEFRSVQERDPKFPIAFNKNYLLRFDPRNRPYGFLMVDLDHFKQINDQYGHEAGDEVLNKFVELIYKILPPGAFLARYGGEEFAIVVPDTQIRELYNLADRINRIMRNLTVVYEGREIKVTVSIGGGVYSHQTTIKSGLKDADEKLYESKNSGRDKSTINTTIK